MDNWNKDNALDFLKQYAPNAPISRCMDFANSFNNIKKENYQLKVALAILSKVLNLTDNGEIPIELIEKFKNDKAILWAIKEVQYNHAWVVCGPFSNAMEKLLEESAEYLSLTDCQYLLRKLKKEEE